MSEKKNANVGSSQIFVTTDKIPRTSIFAQDFPNVLTLRPSAGWQLWRTTPDGPHQEVPHSGIRLEIGDEIIHDTLNGSGKQWTS